MSYNMHAYLVDWSRLAGLYGSEDEQAANAIAAAGADMIAWNDSAYDSEVRSGAPSLSTALNEIIGGRLNHSRHAFQYGFALELISRWVGKALSVDTFADSHVELIADVGIMDAMMENTLLPIPILSSNGFPWIGFLTAEQAVHEYRKYENADLDDDEILVQDAREQYLDWLRQATEESVGIVAFYY